jgi:hypothetical protein
MTFVKETAIPELTKHPSPPLGIGAGEPEVDAHLVAETEKILQDRMLKRPPAGLDGYNSIGLP